MSLHLLRIAPLAAVAMASGAQACMDGRDMHRYFSYQRPVRQGDDLMLRVTVTRIEGNVVYGRLYGPFEVLSLDGSVRIEVANPPMGGNCAEWGPTDGPVFVIGLPFRTSAGGLTLVASPTRSWPPPRRRHSRAEIESYIVDPAYLPPPGGSTPR